MGIVKKVKNAALITIAAGIIGGGVGSQINAINKSYREVLLNNRNYIEHQLKDEYGGKFTRKIKGAYNSVMGKSEDKKEVALNLAYQEADKVLNQYDNLPSSKKNLKAVSDISHWGDIIHYLSVDIPTNSEDIGNTATGGKAGAATGGALYVGLAASKALRRRKKKKGLEKKVAVFISLILGGASLVFMAPRITGNVVGGLSQSQGVLGVGSFILGIIGTYFYFKD